MLGVVLVFLLIFLSFVFWKIDQRTAFLIQQAEQEIAKIEPQNAKLLPSEGQRTSS
jgi:hypothetical protein